MGADEGVELHALKIGGITEHWFTEDGSKPAAGFGEKLFRVGQVIDAKESEIIVAGVLTAAGPRSTGMS